MMFRNAFFLLSIWAVCQLPAISQTNTDSIERALQSLKDDTAKVNLLLATAQAQRFSMPDKSYNYCLQAVTLSEKLSYQLGKAEAYRYIGAYYTDIKNDTSNAFKNYRLADSIYHLQHTNRFKEGIGAIQHALGTIQLRQGNYLEAIQYFIKASKILDSLNNKTILPKTYNNLSTIYLMVKQYNKAEYYARFCVRISEETGNAQMISAGSITLAASLIEEKKFDEALPFILNAQKIASGRNDHYILQLSYFNLGAYYGFYKKDFVNAVQYTEKALEEAKLIGNQWEEARILSNLSGFYYSNKQYEKSAATASEAYETAHSLNSPDLELNSLFNLAQTEAHFGNSKKAVAHMFKAWELKDSIFKEENQQQINFLEANYQSEKKEKEILRLQNEKQISLLILKRRNVIIYALFLTLVLLTGMGLLQFRIVRNKRVLSEKQLEIEKHKVKELENEKLLSATQSVLKGEETERKRLARDLHDGLGGLLSGVKIALNNMKGNVILTGENVNDFNQALGMLDNSIAELRRVAHNMMPEALMKLGLKDTLADYCSELGKVNPMQIDFQFYGEFARVDSNLEINIYRIIQELVNNALKYSEAKELVVQMIQEPQRLCFIIIDNGKGFELKDIQNIKGIGLASVKSRVDTFNGQLEINARPAKGTEITIEFPIL